MNAPATIARDTGLEAELLAAADAAQDELVSLAATLVRFPSLLGEEAAAQDFIEGLFQGMGLRTLRFAVPDAELAHLPGYSPSVGQWPRHDNVVATHRPREPSGRSLILNGHIDVVPVGAADLWTTPPFEPAVRDGRLYGRGAGDMKAGIAAYVTAFRLLGRLGYQPAAPVFLQSVVEEECTGNGALACLHRGFRADAAVIPEPFGETLLTAQVGVMWLTVEVTGRPAHVLDPSKGVNAIEAAFALFQGLKRLVAQWNEPRNRHPAYAAVADPIKLNLGKIQGGEWTSSVPTRCTMDVRIGFYPGMSPGAVRTTVEQCLRDTASNDPALAAARYRVSYAGLQAEGFAVEPGNPLLETLAASHARVAGSAPAWHTSTATTDARCFQLYGSTPTTCYGPEANHIHGIDESVSIDSMLRVTKVLALFMARWCGVEKTSRLFAAAVTP